MKRFVRLPSRRNDGDQSQRLYKRSDQRRSRHNVWKKNNNKCDPHNRNFCGPMLSVLMLMELMQRNSELDKDTIILTREGEQGLQRTNMNLQTQKFGWCAAEKISLVLVSNQETSFPVDLSAH